MRELHVEMDKAVAAAYGWDNLDLGHGFNETAQGMRFTLSEAARREVLARLLGLTHERYEEEVKARLHEKKKAGGSGSRGQGADAEEEGRKGPEAVGDAVRQLRTHKACQCWWDDHR